MDFLWPLQQFSLQTDVLCLVQLVERRLFVIRRVVCSAANGVIDEMVQNCCMQTLPLKFCIIP
jgi:hypothetical protein